MTIAPAFRASFIYALKHLFFFGLPFWLIILFIEGPTGFWIFLGAFMVFGIVLFAPILAMGMMMIFRVTIDTEKLTWDVPIEGLARTVAFDDIKTVRYRLICYDVDCGYPMRGIPFPVPSLLNQNLQQALREHLHTVILRTEYEYEQASDVPETSRREEMQFLINHFSFVIRQWNDTGKVELRFFNDK